MSEFWRNRRVLVTGAEGFIGSHVVPLLTSQGARVVASGSMTRPGCVTRLYEMGCQDVRTVDLTRGEECRSVCVDQDVVLNLAHTDGSVAFKLSRPASIFRRNMLTTLNMLDAACAAGVERFLVVSSSEVYASDAVTPIPESAPFPSLTGRAEDGYAWSKRITEITAGLYMRERGLKVAIARPNNIYGPGDHYNEIRGRVIPTFIHDVFTRPDALVIWGSGEQIRTFLYADDLARGLLDLTERYAVCDPVNFGGEEEVTIRGVAELIVRLSGRGVGVVCDQSKPAGFPKRTVDGTKAQQVIGFRPAVSLESGLRRTIAAYRQTILENGKKLLSAL